MEENCSEVIHQDFPRHHVLHRFIPANPVGAKKILITHGWMSRAAYMMRLIRTLQQQGYDVYALDFPAHGDAKGVQLPWIDAVAIIKETINHFGPFYGIIGHSFGGSMLLNCFNLAGQLPEWKLLNTPDRAILIASPTRMRGPVKKIAKQFNLSSSSYLQLRNLINQHAVDTKLIRLRHFITQSIDTPFLCIHGELDSTVHPEESIIFCKEYKNAHLCILPDADHVSVLMDQRVEDKVSHFLAN
jgi:pimeloyl-ACP methyl ester carboxylesterase